MADTVEQPLFQPEGHAIPAVFGPQELRATETLEPWHFRQVPIPEPQGEDDEELLADIRAAGIKEPLMVTADGRVFNGRARLRHARALGLAQVPVLPLVSPLSDAEIELLAAGLAASRRSLTSVQRFQFLIARRELGEEQAEARSRRRGRPRKAGLTTVSADPSKNQNGKRTDKIVGGSIGAGATKAFKLQAIYERDRKLYKQVHDDKLSVDAAYRHLAPKLGGTGPSRMPPEVLEALEVDIPTRLYELSRKFKDWPRIDQDRWLGLLEDLYEDLTTAIDEHTQQRQSS